MITDPVIRLYLMDKKGRLESFASKPFSFYGMCPNVGEILCMPWPQRKTAYYRVQSRYFVEDVTDQSGWALVLCEMDPSSDILTFMQAWQEDSVWEREMEKEDEAKEAQLQEQALERLLLLSGQTPQELKFNIREESVLDKLSRYGVSKPVPCRAFKDFGEATRKSLLERGFVTINPSSTGKFGDDEIALTAAGDEIFKRLKAHRKKVQGARESKLKGR